MTHCPDHYNCTERLIVLEQKAITLAHGEDLIWKKLNKHIEEGEKDGGFRDRLILAEGKIIDNEKKIGAHQLSIDSFPKHYVLFTLIGAMVGGVIGGLLAQAAPEVFGWIVKLFVKL